MKFVYDADTMGVQVQADHREELTDQQAQVIAALKLAWALEYVGGRLADIDTDLANMVGGK